ncbi:MAG: hypothetical protein RBQ97_05660 [Acholeplasma sp.]|nr:hypothetical protein [Acholeplasma sp.]
MINSDSLNALGAYWISLVDMIESLNNFNTQNINPIYDRELFIKMCYDWQEKIMLKIYEFLPVKIDIQKAETITSNDMNIILDPVDNLFSRNLDISMLTDKLKNLITEEYWDLFIFNYFLRNAILHNRHQMVYVGTLATSNIDVMKMQVRLSIKNRLSKQYVLVLNAIGTSWNGFISNSLFVSKNETSKDVFIHLTIKVDKVRNLVGEISYIYVQSLHSVLEEVIHLSEYEIETNFRELTRLDLVKTISSWIDKIPRIYTRS